MERNGAGAEDGQGRAGQGQDMDFSTMILEKNENVDFADAFMFSSFSSQLLIQ